MTRNVVEEMVMMMANEVALKIVMGIIRIMKV